MTAIKATGISIYRVIVPVLLAACIFAVGLFFFDQFYLPRANKRQDALRNQIKGKPPQTYLNPDRKWIFGQNYKIYFYQLFDSDRNQFGNLSAFQFDPATFQLTRRVYADRAHWYEKVALRLLRLVMAVLTVQFSLWTGKRGALAGVAAAVGIAVIYTTVFRLFESMGNVSQLPPILAAWAPDLIFGLAGGYLILKVPT